MSSTLLRDYLDAALAARLDKNAHQAFLVFLRQLVSYGKTTDPLTDGRINMLSGIRKDRVQDAVGKVAAAGLVDADLRENGWNRYSIPVQFFGGNRPTRFFAPAFPMDGEISQPMGGFPNGWEHTEYLPIQISTNTETNSSAPAQPVCDVVEKECGELTKPEVMSATDYTDLLPSLRKLPNTTALDVLALTSAAILNRSIKTTVQKFAGGLIKAAQAGTLDTYGLRKPETVVDEVAETAKQMAEIKRQAAEIETPYRLAGVALPDREAQRLGELAKQYQTLKQKIPATAATVPGMA